MNVAENFHEFSTRPENLDFGNNIKVKEKLLQLLKSLTESLKNAPNRESLPNYIFADMLNILARLAHCIHKRLTDEAKGVSDKTLGLVDVATECFRSLRNSCAGCKKNQEECRGNPGLYWTAATIMSTLVNSTRGIDLPGSPQGKKLVRNCQEVVQCLRCGVQFLGNAAAGFEESKSLVWDAVFTTIRPLLKAEDTTLANYTCMLVYTCLTTSNMSDLIKTAEGVDIITAVMDHFSKHENEWGLYIMEKLLAHPSFIETSYKKLKDKERITLMSFVCSKLKTLEDKADGRNHSQQMRDAQSEIKVALGNIQFISSEFKSKAHTVLKLTKLKDLENSEPMMVTKMLEVLCSATSTNHYQELQDDTDLLKCSINLLQSMNLIGKQGTNIFSSLSKISEAGQANQDHPAFGLKRDTIRLIGNLCYHNKQNQDLVREMEGITLIMDHTNMDARNPFITQWAVLAIRNLCENNAENQAVIANLKLEGMGDNASVLGEFGVDAQLEGEKVVVKPAKKDEKSPFAKFGKR